MVLDWAWIHCEAPKNRKAERWLTLFSLYSTVTCLILCASSCVPVGMSLSEQERFELRHSVRTEIEVLRETNPDVIWRFLVTISYLLIAGRHQRWCFACTILVIFLLTLVWFLLHLFACFSPTLETTNLELQLWYSCDSCLIFISVRQLRRVFRLIPAWRSALRFLRLALCLIARRYPEA